MERLNKKTLSFPAKVFTRAFAALGMVLALAACKNGGGGGAVVGPIYGNGCANCGSMATPVQIGTFESESFFVNQLRVKMSNVQMIGDARYFQPGVSSSYNLYRGDLAIQGDLTVLPYNTVGYACAVPVGTFRIETFRIGSINQGADLVVPELVAGPLRLRMEISTGLYGSMLVKDSYGVARWNGLLRIISVNGQPCDIPMEMK